MVNIVLLDDEIFSMFGGNKEEVYDLWKSDLEDDLIDEFELHIYDSAKKALKKIEELGNNTIVILDMKMPEIDGATFLKMIREKEYTIPVIAYSADEIYNNTIMDLLRDTSFTKEQIIEKLLKKDYFEKEEMKAKLLKNDIFSYVRKADSDLTNLIKSINKAIEKFKDNIPLELGEALDEYLDRHKELKSSSVLVKEGDNVKEILFSDIHEEINKGTMLGKDYQKAMYKLAFEDLRKKEKQI